ncbi:MAG: hypothetical protein IJJ33_17970, partial [Victivallales bacterium]|nr:hypothetical protein [Victivallales bacterium]
MLWCLLIIALLAPEVLSGEEKPSGQATNQRESFLVENRELPVTTVVRVKSATEKKESIGTPVAWQPLSTIIADGSKVQEGEVLATFVSSEAEYELKSLLYRQKQTEANVESRIRDIDNRNLDMGEQMDQLKDKLAALEAKLARQQSEPTADDLSIVEGRLRIARVNLDGAEKDYRKAQDRFARQMISRAELDNAEKDLAQKRAKEEFARLELEVTQTPPRRDVDLQTTQLDIVTARLEIDKLQFEIDEQLKISDIQKEAAVVSRDRIKRRIDEQQEYIDKVTVKAPASGFLSINRYDNNEIVPGARMWKNFIFMEIPDLETICFNGVLPEARRAFHEVGDQVKVFVNGRKDRPLTGTICSISTLSHDLTDKEEAGWNRDQKANGVKVFDVVIALDKNEAWLRPGMFGAATIHAAKSAQGPAVPLRFVREQDGKFFLSVDGIYQEVSGYEMDGWFVLDNPLLCGKTILLSGVFQAEVEALGRKEVDARLSATGEVMPVKSIQIPVGDIGWWPWPKITWLKEEETMVKAGDEVIKLDPESRVKQVQEQEASLIEARSGRDELEKRVELTRRDGDFRLRVAENRRSAARLHANYILEVVPPLPVHTARRDVKLAQIALEHQKRKVEREDVRPEPILAPAELARMHRELERCRLKLEQAQLKLQKAEEGATDIEKSKA